jgi:dTDP-4-amino-4,6-dideoxygalactose transaminase
MIPFNKPFFIGSELAYVAESVASGKISGDGMFTKKCHAFFEERYGFPKSLLCTSCTDALEMAAILSDIQPGDEVICPSYTFVSTVNAFVLRGAEIVFADSESDNPNIDASLIEGLITDKTKVILPVHYAGVACEMDTIMKLAKKYNLKVIEDAAQAINSFYKGKPLGSFGDFAAFSFHETKNIIAGEGGMLVVNDDKSFTRAEIIREKGTNRSQFFRGEVDKYGWVDIGSSFLPSDIIAAYLFAQLEHLDQIQQKRVEIWNHYYKRLKQLEIQGKLRLANIPDYATNNGHMFYLLCHSLEERSALIQFLKSNGVMAVFHYQSLHQSTFMKNHYNDKSMPVPNLPNADLFTETLVRLPFYFELSASQIDYVCDLINNFFEISPSQLNKT